MFGRPPLAALFAVPVLSTLGGGLLAIHCRRSLHTLAAIGAGILLGAAFLDLLPEAVSLGIAAGFPVAGTLGMALGSFLLFFFIDTLLEAFTRKEGSEGRSLVAGRIAGGLLILHSFRDGMAIGASFAASPAAGYAVALGIGAHDFGDGLNTVLLTTRGKQPQRLDYMFLFVDALAPVAGGLAAVWYFSSLKNSVFLLAVAGGFFLQMAACDLLPELRRSVLTRKWTIPAILAGAAMIYEANLLLRSLH